ncbi:MAG TPA: M20/M25/M40 family metallo-hydrolase [Candidatus Limnocylindrales bacterium]
MAFHRRPFLEMALACALLLSCGPADPPRPSTAVSPSPTSTSASASGPTGPNPETVATAITEAGLARRLAELEAITREADGYRSLGSAGYARAVGYLKSELGALGWTVSTDAFGADVFAPGVGGSLVAGTSTFDGDTMRPLRFAPGGTAEGPLAALGWSPGPASAGCAAKDYASLPAKAVVVVRAHWECTVRDEVIAAQEAGVAAFIAADAVPPSDVVPMIDLQTPAGLRIPAAAVSWNTALLLVGQAEQRVRARLETHAVTRTVPTESVIADLPGVDASRVLIVGAHLDSSPYGPGLNDDGSGVAALLELARALGGTRPRVGIRLAFWAAEENGLSGSGHYLGALGLSGLRSIVAYLNADMIGAANGYVGVYADPSAPPGSSSIATLIAAAIQRHGGAFVDVDMTGTSDHWVFEQAGIPTGGVFGGAGDRVTAAEATTQGANAGQPADACYHTRCDTSANVRLPLARLLAAALADAAVRLAEDTSLLAP